jgi:hypothetical protein
MYSEQLCVQCICKTSSAVGVIPASPKHVSNMSPYSITVAVTGNRNFSALFNLIGFLWHMPFIMDWDDVVRYRTVLHCYVLNEWRKERWVSELISSPLPPLCLHRNLTTEPPQAAWGEVGLCPACATCLSQFLYFRTCLWKHWVCSSLASLTLISSRDSWNNTKRVVFWKGGIARYWK